MIRYVIINSITIDSYGYMAVGCWYGRYGYIIALYNAINGTYLDFFQLSSYQPSNYPSFTAVDASERFVIMSQTAIYIYY